MKKEHPIDFVLAIGTAIGFLAILLLLVFVEVPQGSKDTITVMIQALIGFVGMIFAYRFGSSKGSREKDETIAQAVNKNPSDSGGG